MAKTSKAKKTVVYLLERVVTGKFSYELPKKRPEGDKLEVSYTMTPIISVNAELEKVFIKMKVDGIVASTKEEIVNIETLFIFKVQDLKSHVILKNNNYVFNSEYKTILATFVGICISTIRGILIEKLSGTMLGDKLVPIINPNSFFQDPPNV